MDDKKPVVVFKNISLVSLMMLIHDMPKTLIDDTDLSGSVFKIIGMPASSIDDAKFIESTWRDCNLSESCIADTDFTETRMRKVNMHGVGFTRVKFINAHLNEVDFAYAIMLEVDFTGATLTGVNFGHANFDYATIDFTDATFDRCYIPMEVAKLLNLTQTQMDGLLSEPLPACDDWSERDIEAVRREALVSDDSLTIKIPIPVMPLT